MEGVPPPPRPLVSVLRRCRPNGARPLLVSKGTGETGPGGSWVASVVVGILLKLKLAVLVTVMPAHNTGDDAYGLESGLALMVL